jgi:chaperonin GroES
MGGTAEAPCRGRHHTRRAPVAGGRERMPSRAAPSIIAAMTRKSSGSSSDTVLETVEPIGARVLVRKDEDKKITKKGIHLPDKIEIPTLTGRIVAISAQVAGDSDYPIQKYDKVLFNPKHAIPVDLEGDNRLFVVPVEDVVAVFRKSE